MAEVKFKFVGDDSELRKKLANLAKIQSEMTEKFSEDLNRALSGKKSQVFKDLSKEAANAAGQTERLNKIAANKAIVNAKLEQINSIRRLREERSKEISELNNLKKAEQEHKANLASKKSEIQSLIQQERELNLQYRKGQIATQEYNRSLKEQAEERRKANQAEREAEKALKASEKARRDAEREASKQAKETAKRKKQLEQESSEYYKLNKALGAVRKEAKDVLAEMFRMERQGHANTLGYEALRKKSEGLTKQTQLLDQGIKKIDASLGLHQRNVGNYGGALELLGPQFESINQKLSIFGTSIEDLAGKPSAFKELGIAVAGLGKQLLAFIATPVGAAIAALGAFFGLFQTNKQTVIDFNSGLRDVSKTTGIAGEDLNDFGDAIIALSMKLKVIDSTKLLEYATVAGQLGVKGRADILAFTEALAMLETASDIKGEEGATEIARMLTLVDGGVQNVKEFGDEIVNLGNNFAATEKEILSNAEQISQNTGIYKIARQEVLAFATATKAVGLEAELVGSTFSRTLGEFEKTIRSGKGVNDLLKVIGGTSAELSKRFKDDAAGVFVDYVRGLNNIDKSGGSVNEALERTGIIAVRDQRVIASLATNGFDVLTDALDKVKTAQGAMQAEFENGAGKLEQQSKRMGIAWDNFVLSIENGEGAIGRSVVAITGFFASLLDQINKTFNPTSIDEFLARLTSFEKADKIRDYNIVYDSGSKSFSSIVNTTPTASNVKELMKETESSIKAVTEAYNKYKDDVSKGVLTEGGKAKLKDYESLLKNLQTKQYQLRILGGDAKAVTPITFEESEADKKKAEAAQKVAERRAEQARQAVERQRKLQGDIEALANQSTRNQLSRDEEEIASIKDKYAKMREEIRKFYADPKNKGLRVDEGKLKQAESFEISESTTRQGTKELVKQLNEQRSIYEQYNAYVEQNGVEAAKRMFGDQAQLAEDYKSTLEKEYMDIISLQKTSSLAGFDGTAVKLTQAQEERAKELKQMLDALNNDEVAKQRAKYAEMLKLSEDNEIKVNAIRKKYSDAYEQLEKDKTRISTEEYQKRVEALKKGQADEIGAILLPDLQKGQDWVNVFDKTSTLARTKILQSVETLRASLKKMHDEGKITVEQYNDALKGIRDVEVQVSVSDRGFGRIKQILKELKEAEKDSIRYDEARQKLAGEIANFGDALVEASGDMLNIMDQLGIGSEKFKEDMAFSLDLAGNAVNLAASIASGDVVGMITNGIKTISSAINLFTKDRKIERQIKEYQKQLEQLGKTYDDLAKKMADSDTNFYANSEAALRNLKAQERQIIQMQQAERSKKKTDAEKLKTYDQELLNNRNQQHELEKSIREMRLQTDINSLAKSITDALVGAFEAGEDGIHAMDKAFDDFIKNSLANSVRLKFIQGFVEDMLADVDDYMSKNGDSIAGYDFGKWEKRKNDAINFSNEFLDAAYEGLGLEKESSKNTSTISGKIKTELTEKTGGELVGISRAGYDIWKQQLVAIQAQSATSVNLLAIANEKLITLNAIQMNTANTVQRLDVAVKHLDTIVKNTSKTGRSAEGMGL